MLTKGQERCLYVFPVAEFGRITDALRTAPVTAKAVRDYSRVFFASASDEVPDKQGRITIPPGAARVRGAAARLRGHRGQHPPGDLGRRRLGPYLAEQEDAFSDGIRGGAARSSVSGARCSGAAVPGEVSTRAWATTSAGVTSPAPGGRRPVSVRRGWGPGRGTQAGRRARPGRAGMGAAGERGLDGQAAAGHLPVMSDRVLALFAPALQPRGAVLVDATLGRAGHAARCWTLTRDSR